MRIVLLGAPGSGKGTQSARLREALGVPQISTGDILRKALAEGSELGRQAESFMQSGRLVPDDVILGMVRERLSAPDASGGFILDGFPRTIPQAQGLETILAERGTELDRVILIDVSTESILVRMTSRRVCGSCGSVFNLITQPPAQDGICDRCGSKLLQREDDREETVRRRLAVYAAETAPLIDYYQGAGLLLQVQGDASVDEVTDRIGKALGRNLGRG